MWFLYRRNKTRFGTDWNWCACHMSRTLLISYLLRVFYTQIAPRYVYNIIISLLRTIRSMIIVVTDRHAIISSLNPPRPVSLKSFFVQFSINIYLKKNYARFCTVDRAISSQLRGTCAWCTQLWDNAWCAPSAVGRNVYGVS